MAGRTLTGLELIQIPATDGEIATILVHAIPEAGDLLAAHSGSLVRGRLDGFSLLLLDGSRGTAGEEAADGVADGRSDCHATGAMLALVVTSRGILGEHTQRWRPSGQTSRVLGWPVERSWFEIRRVDRQLCWQDEFEESASRQEHEPGPLQAERELHDREIDGAW